MKNTQALYLVKKLAAEMAEDGREDMAEALGISEKLLDKVISEEKQEYASTRKVNPPSARYRGINVVGVRGGDLLSRIRGNS